MKFLWIRLCLIILFLIQGVNGRAQDSSTFKKINRDSIKALISNSTRETYYSKLEKRMNEFDTNLTLEDYRLLYYGYVFDSNYSAYGSTQKGEIYKLLDDKKYLSALNLSDSVLKTMPVSLSANMVKLVVLYTMSPDEKSEYYKWKYRYMNLRDAVLSTGNGKSCETAFKTIFVPDEYDLLRYFDIEENTQYLVGDCDMFDIKSSKYFSGKHIYFDTSETLNQLDNMFKKKDK